MSELEERIAGLEEKVKQIELFRMEEDEIAKLRSRLAHEKWANRSKTIQHNKLLKLFNHLQDQLAARKAHCLKAHNCCYEVPID